MRYNHLKQLRLAFRNNKEINFFLCKRCFSDVNPFMTARSVNPLRKHKRPPVTIENESRIANRICITILGNGGIGQPRCVGLFTDLKSYLFNCGEGVGRFCREYDVNICFIKHIFVTQMKWRNMSGISDIFLTNQCFGVSQMSLHGPPGIEEFLLVMNTERKEMDFHIKKPSNKFHIDHTLKIEYVPVEMETFHRRGKSNIAFSYICEIFEKKGDFLAEKCVEYGVPLGPDLLKLKNGENIILPSGKTVYSEDVHGSTYPGTVILVVDCPSESYLESFVNEKKFEKYQLPLNTSLDVSTIFHFTPSHIFHSVKYQVWMNRFHQDTQHFVLNSDNSMYGSAAVHLCQKYFNLLHPKIFSTLKEVKKSSDAAFLNSENILHAPPMLQLHIRPEKKLSWTNVVDPEKEVEEDGTEPVKSSPEFYARLNNFKSSIIKETLLNVTNTVYPEVLFLGTSSSTSTAYRNVSAILINTDPHNSVLLDCGEGTMMQFVRYYGSDVYTALHKISCIFISHKHIDHYLGLFELVSQRVKAFEVLGIDYQPVVLVLPYDIKDIFMVFCKIFEDLFRFVKIFNCSYLKTERSQLKPYLSNIGLVTVPVIHCIDAHGVVLQKGSEWKIVYSGDASPSQKLIDAGQDCTVLIHEASIEDGMINEANSKKHSTPSQVIDIAEKMNAQYVILTHFSKRYLAVPVLPECTQRHIAPAFDFMKVRMCDWPILPHLMSIMKLLFQEQLISHSERTSSNVNFEKTFLKVLKS